MTLIWRVLQTLAIAAALVLGGVGAVAAVSALLAHLARWLDEGPVLPPRPTPKAGFEGLTRRDVDRLRHAADARRTRALEVYHQAHGIASGEPEPARGRTIEIVKR